LLGDTPLAALAADQVGIAALMHPSKCIAVQRDPFLPHPVYLPQRFWEWIRPTNIDNADRGLRELLYKPETIWITPDSESPIADVDTPEDVPILTETLQA